MVLPKVRTAQSFIKAQSLREKFASLRKDSFPRIADNVGQVLTVKDGVAVVWALSNVGLGELVFFQDKEGNRTQGMALSLERNSVSCVIFGDESMIRQGDLVLGTGKPLKVFATESMVGRVLDGLGQVIDGKGPLVKAPGRNIRVERLAPGIITRQSVHEPMMTGYKVVDALIPIGRGQRELIIGDRQTGKTTLAIDTILNQKEVNQYETEVFCVYVAIGQKRSSVLNLVNLLEKADAFKYTIVVAATASQSAALQFIAPYTGCAIAEFFRDTNRHALIVYDDLTKHAAAYRQMSLLLRRPPGREAFPGDVFYIHSRLLERAAKLNAKHGSGSLTALPIVETQAGDLSGFIPTNVISITDGQIFLERELFFQGFRPAVNIGASVSRVGSKAQHNSLKKVVGSLKLELAQYRELSAFSKFDSEMDEITREILDRGDRIMELLKQPAHSPMNLGEQVCILLAVTFGFLDDLPITMLTRFEREFLNHLATDTSANTDCFLYYLESLSIDDEPFEMEESAAAIYMDYYYMGFHLDNWDEIENA